MSKSDAANPDGGKSTVLAGIPVGPQEEASIGTALLKTLRHFLPDLSTWLKTTSDPRDPRFITYPIDYILASGRLLFLTKLGSRRQIRYQFKTLGFIRNLNDLCGTNGADMLDPDTLAYLLERLPLKALEELRHAILYTLLRKKVFDNERLLGKYFRVAIDGTGYLAFRERHCEHCLTQEHPNTTVYYHPVLEAKLVPPSGLALSMATEFIENSQPGMSKQDCERKAFERLAKRLKKDFPQLSICVLLDGLYACGPVFALCQRQGWRFIVTFKEGGRLRWKIENEGFHIQKNNGYEMEHAYSEPVHAAKNFYLLLQIAHLLSQLVEKGLLAKKMAKTIGAIKNVARFLLEELRQKIVDIEEMNRILQQRIQIRFADSS